MIVLTTLDSVRRKKPGLAFPHRLTSTFTQGIGTI